MTYVVEVIVRHDEKRVFSESAHFSDGESRDYMRGFLKNIGDCIESYDIRFDDDDNGEEYE